MIMLAKIFLKECILEFRFLSIKSEEGKKYQTSLASEGLYFHLAIQTDILLGAFSFIHTTIVNLTLNSS